MFKKAIFIGVGMVLLAAPFVSSAATAGSAIPPCPSLTRSLSIGARGSDVTALQQFLSAQGYLAVSATGYFGVLTKAAVGRWQAQNGIAAFGSAGSGIFGPLSRSYLLRLCGVSTTGNIQRLNAPGSVSLQPGGIAEIRNESFYFTLQGLSLSSATIQITAVGCWNSFPSDTPPQIRCMIAVVPIPPQTLSVGQTYSAANYRLTLTQISSGTATFSVVQ